MLGWTLVIKLGIVNLEHENDEDLEPQMTDHKDEEKSSLMVQFNFGQLFDQKSIVDKK